MRARGECRMTGRGASLRRRPRPAVRTVPAPARTGVFTERTVRAQTVARRRNGRAAAPGGEVAVVERVDEVCAPLAPLAILAAGPLAPAVAVAEVRADEGAAALPEVRAVMVRVDEVFADGACASRTPSDTGSRTVSARGGGSRSPRGRSGRSFTGSACAEVRAVVVRVDEVFADEVLDGRSSC